MLLSEILKNTADHSIHYQRPNGSFPEGHNGPYYDPETPVRNTAHYLYFYSAMYERHGEQAYREVAEKAIGYLLSKEARPHGYTLHCRDKSGKDRCNGLVGQAWVIEALIKAAVVFQRDELYEIAEELFLLHPWDEKLSIWNRVDIDGKILSYDGTFNHQLWFAAAAAQLNETPVAYARALSFLRDVVTKLKLYRDGTIYHWSPMGRFSNYRRHGLVAVAREGKSRFRRRKAMSALYSKSVGYHGFNLYALAILKLFLPNEKIWDSSMIHRTIQATRKNHFHQALKQDVFGYRYNVSGIEFYLGLSVLADAADSEMTLWMKRQVRETLEDEHALLSCNVPDKNTARARIYQAIRIPNDPEINLDK